MAVTIKEIAEAVGVSRGTVDRALHNRKGVNPELAKKIKSIAKQMGYSPNKAGKVLASRKKPIKIGCMLPSLGNEFFKDVIKGYKLKEKELSDFGLSIALEEVSGYEEKTHTDAVSNLLNKEISALCLSTIDVPKIRTYVNNIIDSGIPVITVNSDLSFTKRLCYVGSRYIEAGRTAAGLIKKMKPEYLNTLIITGSCNVKGHNQRINGFKKEIEKSSIPFNVVDFIESYDNNEYSYQETILRLKKYPQTNYIYVTGAGTFGVCSAVVELKREKDIIISTFDDVSSTKEFLKKDVIDFTICQEPEIQGSQSINLMFDYFMSGKSKTLKNHYTNTVIKIKENL